MTIRVVVHDDDDRFREGIERSLANQGFDVVAPDPNGVTGFELAELTRPHVILADVPLPQPESLEAIRHMKAVHPEIKIIVFSSHGEPAIVNAALGAGCDGYMVKACSTEEVGDALRMACSAPPIITAQHARLLRDQIENEASGRALGFDATEREIIRRLADDAPPSEIAEELGIGRKAMKNHLASIWNKFRDDGGR